MVGICPFDIAMVKEEDECLTKELFLYSNYMPGCLLEGEHEYLPMRMPATMYG